MGNRILKLQLWTVVMMGLLALRTPVFASDDHDHEKKDKHDHAVEKDHKEEDGHDHGKEEKHDEKDSDEHGHGDEGHSDHGEEKDGHGHEEESSKFGPGKAILGVKNEGQKFQLSPDSIQFLKIGFSKITRLPAPGVASQSFSIPSEALVSFQNKKGVFILEDGWIELVEVNVLRKDGSQTFVESKAIHNGDEVATKGVPFLRVAHLEASGQGGEGHAH